MVKYQIPGILKAWPFNKFKTGPDAQCFCHCESKQQWQTLVTLKKSMFSVQCCQQSFVWQCKIILSWLDSSRYNNFVAALETWIFLVWKEKRIENPVNGRNSRYHDSNKSDSNDFQVLGLVVLCSYSLCEFCQCI